MSHLEWTKKIWSEFLRPGDLVVDATCGAGRDTAFLCRCVPQGRVYALDIQQEALDRTKALLEKEGLVDRVVLQKSCHSAFPKLTAPPRLVVYNLGYLPGGDKRRTTMTPTTLTSVERALELIRASNGALSITCYPGHEEGAREEGALLDFARELPPHQWLVSHHHQLNRPEAPSVLWIQVAQTPLR